MEERGGVTSRQRERPTMMRKGFSYNRHRDRHLKSCTIDPGYVSRIVKHQRDSMISEEK
jgi:hypothetical protein